MSWRLEFAYGWMALIMIGFHAGWMAVGNESAFAAGAVLMDLAVVAIVTTFSLVEIALNRRDG